MCRRQELYCMCLMSFGLGMLIGHWLDSWFWSGGGGVVLIAVGFSMMRRR